MVTTRVNYEDAIRETMKDATLSLRKIPQLLSNPCNHHTSQ